MNKFLLIVFATALISFGVASSVSAGQISVINPSSGSEVSGVVVVISTPQVAVASGSPATASLSSGLSGSDRSSFATQSALSISQVLASVDVDTFTADQKLEVVSLIEALLLNPKLSRSKRALIEQQLGRF